MAVDDWENGGSTINLFSFKDLESWEDVDMYRSGHDLNYHGVLFL